MSEIKPRTAVADHSYSLLSDLEKIGGTAGRGRAQKQNLTFKCLNCCDDFAGDLAAGAIRVIIKHQ